MSIGTLQKNLRVKLKSTVLSKAVVRAADRSGSLSVPDSDNSNLIADKMITPRRKTKSNIRHLKNDEIKSSSDAKWYLGPASLSRTRWFKIDMMSSTVMVICSHLALPDCFDFSTDELMKYPVIGKNNKEWCLFSEMVAIDGLDYVNAK